MPKLANNAFFKWKCEYEAGDQAARLWKTFPVRRPGNRSVGAYAPPTGTNLEAAARFKRASDQILSHILNSFVISSTGGQ